MYMNLDPVTYSNSSECQFAVLVHTCSTHIGLCQTVTDLTHPHLVHTDFQLYPHLEKSEL